MIHHVFANRSNIGDWLAALGIQRLLAPTRVTEHLCDEPFVPETLEQLARLGADDVIVIGGGGLFMDYFAPFWRGLLQLAPSAPVVIWGAGYCDLKLEHSLPDAELLAAVVRSSRHCIVRDELTRQYLAIDALPAPVSCPSIAVVPPRPLGLGLLHVDNYTTAGADVFEAMDDQGREFARASERPYRRTNNRIDRTTAAALDATLHLYERSDVVLSSALHGCIIGLAMGRKVLAVSGDRKIEAFMQAAGLGDWVLDLAEVDHVPERLRGIGAQAAPREFIARTIRANEEIAALVLALAERTPRRDAAAGSVRGGAP